MQVERDAGQRILKPMSETWVWVRSKSENFDIQIRVQFLLRPINQ